ncbi:MAG: PIG-L family deacetylase [Fimbriimonadales bacterium]|nr:PIG-L family deacetylase [Fimbriimonadales bacterium]
MKRWLLRIALAIAGGLSSYIGLSALLFVAATHRASLSQESHHWQHFPPLTSDDRLLIIAPHPDDEVLGCGGLMATAARAGVPIKVVYLTAGDGFAAAAALTSRSAPDARDCLQLGQIRMQESLRALRALGLNDTDAVFLGYPDRGLLPMAVRPRRVFRSSATQAQAVPYADALTPNAPHTAAAVVADLRGVLAAFQPTRVFTTHPLDDHEDHTAAALFTHEAIAQAVQAGELTHFPVLYYYIVHRGDWPLPQGEHRDRPLVPPLALLTENWQVATLSHEVQERKRLALQAHESQYAIMARFLSSFLRTNELFAPASPPRAYHVQPFDDNATIHLQPRADIVSVQAQAGRAGVRVSVETLKPFRAPYQMEITLLTVDPAGNWSDSRWRYPNRRLSAKQEGTALHLWLPHSAISNAERAYLMVSIKLYGAELDRTGFLPVPLAPPNAESDAPTPLSTPQSAPSPVR